MAAPVHAGADEAPLVSVIIPHFNREPILARALRSIEAQTYRPIEVLVVDDASPADPTEGVRRLGLSIPVRVVRLTSNAGPSAARNIGVTEAAGQFVAFLDSDDEWKPAKLAVQVRAARGARNPDRVFCIAQTVIQHADRLETRRVWDPETERLGEFLFMRDGTMQTSAFLLARRLARIVTFDPTIRQFEDNLFLLKALEAEAEFLFQTGHLFTWFRDDRDDQLSRKVSLSSGDRFLTATAAILNERERLAFTTRILGPALVKRRPAYFARLALRALFKGVLTPRKVAGIVYRSRNTRLA